MLAVGVPSSFFRFIVPAVAVYFTVCPLIWMECDVVDVFSSTFGGAGAGAGAAGAVACDCAGGAVARTVVWAGAAAASARINDETAKESLRIVCKHNRSWQRRVRSIIEIPGFEVAAESKISIRGPRYVRKLTSSAPGNGRNGRYLPMDADSTISTL
jgi:hypothetical protein